ncbi:MAG: flagellar export protein FliJ [Planctomycetota bacterium]|jgi:flagellar export protein FliJ
MRRFRFRLASLLRLRSQIERSARKELALAMAEVNNFDSQLAAAGRGLADCADQASRTDSVGFLARSMEAGLRRHQWRLVKQRKSAEQKLEAVRVEYTQKARELKTLQRLRHQELSEWNTELQRTEQAELDEMALLTRGREDGEDKW